MEEEKEETVELTKTPEVSIDGLVALSDEELGKVLGYDKKVEQVRGYLSDMQALTGKAREYAENKIKERFTPNVDNYDFKYIAEDAKRATKSGKEAAEDCCCRSVI